MLEYSANTNMKDTVSHRFVTQVLIQGLVWPSFYFPIWLSFFYFSALFSKIQTDIKWKQKRSRVDFFPHFYMPAENFSSQKVLLEFTHFACENIEQ